jgi:replicative DNA helicase
VKLSPTIEDRQPQLERLCRAVFGGPEEEAASAAEPVEQPRQNDPTKRRSSFLVRTVSGGIPEGEDERLRYAFARNPKFERCYNGDTSYHAGDQSRTDLYVCGQLSWWFDGEAAIVERLFRLSKLFRPKCDEKHYSKGDTYLQRMIAKAVADPRNRRSPQGETSGERDGQEHNPQQQAGADADGPPDEPAQAAEADGYRFQVLTSAEFAVANYRPQWLIKGLMARHLACIFGGPRKCLKTSLLMELALSLGSGIAFLNKFEVPKICRTVFLSAESGPWTLQETAHRICAAKGIRLADTNTLFGFELPQLANPKHMEEFADGLVSAEAEVVIIDPLYIALLAGVDAKYMEASNLFDMGPLLRRVAQTCLKAGCTPILAHHSVKRLQAVGEPLELEDLAFAGIQEFARTWVLVNRREAFDPATPGFHQLWMSVGGSIGVAKLLALDITEGELQDDFSGRRWELTVTSGGQARAKTKNQKADAKAEEAKKKDRADDTAFLAALSRIASGSSQAVPYGRVRDLSGLPKDRASRAFERLLAGKFVQRAEVEVTVGNGAKRKVVGLYRTASTEVEG